MQSPKYTHFFKWITSSRRSLSYPWGSRGGVEMQCHRRYSHVVISVMSSAELWQPCTTLLVHSERSRLVSVLNRCVSIPCLVPVRVAKDKSTPDCGEPFPGPEWTNLQLKTHHWIITLTEHTVSKSLPEHSSALSFPKHVWFRAWEQASPLYLSLKWLLVTLRRVKVQGSEYSSSWTCRWWWGCLKIS